MGLWVVRFSIRFTVILRSRPLLNVVFGLHTYLYLKFEASFVYELPYLNFRVGV
jgi:hypothetical protein